MRYAVWNRICEDMIQESIFSYIIEKALVILPRQLTIQFVPPHKIADQVYIDLRSENPIDISFGSDVPRIDIYFKISNMSAANLVLDRLLIIDLWIGQPTLQGAILERYDVPKRSIKEGVHFIDQLTIPQQEQIKKRVDGKLLSVPVKVHVKAYFESKVGLICVEKRLERSEVLVR